jgi:hypothetical protein
MNKEVGMAQRLELLARTLYQVKNDKSVLNRAVKDLDDEQKKAEAEIMILLRNGGGGYDIGQLDSRIENGVSHVVIGKRSGGGHFVKPWEKDTVVLANPAYMKKHNLLGRV